MAIRLTIDGHEVEAQEGQTVLEVAREAGVWIPALCHHPAVSSYGACRLCLVEVKVRGRTRLVTSCCYPVRDGMEVFTQTEKVMAARRGVMELLLARAPESPTLRELAEKLGVTEPRLPKVTEAEGDCILCGLCVNVCTEVMGAAAISFVNRGVDRVVAAPFLESSEACLGCGACAAVCPMGSVELRWEETELEVVPFNNRRPAMRCRECGAPISGLPFAQQVQERLGEKLALAVSLCPDCKRKATALAAKKARAASGAWPHLRAGVREQ
jgi:bidirectional [NiFe] hydrogenase diaphorase subunit